MSIQQNIVDAMEISKYTKIPVLFMSNPGLGKTTILNKYAKHFGYHLETLIGSRFTPEEISGYQVNAGGDHLTHLNPEWFNRILVKAKEGKKTLLFIDELSTCSEWVQGALLSLIFDRSIGNGKMLPDNCFIVAAANYAGNLPSSMSLMAPTLNRFIIINLNDNYTNLDMLEEFLTAPEQVKFPKRIKQMDEDARSKFMENYKKNWQDIFLKYSNPKSTVGHLDISNRNIDGLYSKDGSVYNFISGRSVSYLSKAILAYILLDIDNKDIFFKIVDGLAGAGTCLFTSQQTEEHFRDYLHKQMIRLVDTKTITSTGTFQKLQGDVSRDVAAFIINKENMNFTATDEVQQLSQLTKTIVAYFDFNNVMKNFPETESVTRFISHYDSLMDLRNHLRKSNRNLTAEKQLTKIAMDYYGLYCEIMDLPCDYKKKFGETNKYFKKISIIRLLKDKKYVYSRAALDNNGDYHYMENNESFLSVYPAPNTVFTNAKLEVVQCRHNNFSFVPMKR